jgi:hypothetical protein
LPQKCAEGTNTLKRGHRTERRFNRRERKERKGFVSGFVFFVLFVVQCPFALFEPFGGYEFFRIFRGFKNSVLPLSTLRPALRDCGGRALFVLFAVEVRRTR